MGKKSGRPRAGLIREAVARYVAEQKTEELDRIYEEGYRKFPEDDLSWAEAQEKMLPDVWGVESW